MLEPILKGLVEWIFGLMVDIMSYASGQLIGVLSMDLSYFEKTAPIISDIVNVFIAFGWALLIGNLVFQLLKSMASGMGFEAEEPKIIFLRTFVFAFLLLSSRQICDIGLSMTGKVIDLLQLPDAIHIKTPDESMFQLAAEAKWLLVVIVGIILMLQMVKLLFEIGERYVITSVLTFFAPLAFSMGGSKNTNDIFKGWVRMYCSMLLMMIMNIVFLKLIMSAMMQMSSGNVLIWLVFVVALTRVARKIDSHIGKIGLNPAQTGDEIGSRLPGMMTLMAVKAMSSAVGKSIAGSKVNKLKNANSIARQHTSGRNIPHRYSGSGPVGGSNSYNSSSHSTNTPGVKQNNNTSGTNSNTSANSVNGSGNVGGVGATPLPRNNSNKTSMQNTNAQSGNHTSRISNNGRKATNSQINGSVSGNNGSANLNLSKNDVNDTKGMNKEGVKKNRPPLPRDVKGMTEHSCSNKTQSEAGSTTGRTMLEGADYTKGYKANSVNKQFKNEKAETNEKSTSEDNHNTFIRRDNNMSYGGKDIRVRKGNAFETNKNQKNSEYIGSQTEYLEKMFTKKTNIAENSREKRNPAAVNKKTKNNYYKQGRRIEKENNGKRKQ